MIKETISHKISFFFRKWKPLYFMEKEYILIYVACNAVLPKIRISEAGEDIKTVLFSIYIDIGIRLPCAVHGRVVYS